MVVDPSPRFGGSSGFSLLELLIAMTISVAIMGSIVLVASQLNRSYYQQLDSAAVQQEGRYALEWILRALRSAGANAEAISTSPCPAAGTTFRTIQRNPNGDAVQDDVRIHADINPPNGLLGGLATGNCTETGEDITIRRDATNNVITRQDNNTQTLAQADVMTDSVISGLTFAYLNAARGTATTDGAVVYVQVAVTAQTPTIDNNTGQRPTYTYTGEVRIRTR